MKHGHSGMKDLLREVVSRGCPITQRACETVISVCSQCCTQTGGTPPAHFPTAPKDGKGDEGNLVGRLHWSF